jgi:hypothetical protein
MNEVIANHPGSGRWFFLAYRDAFHERLGRTYCEASFHNAAEKPVRPVAEWKFEMLMTPTMREFAIAEAENAAAIVVSTRAGEALPAGVKDLLARCGAEDHCRPRSLVVLLSGGKEHPDEVCPDRSFLRSEANRLGASLWVWADGTPVGSEECSATEWAVKLDTEAECDNSMALALTRGLEKVAEGSL